MTTPLSALPADIQSRFTLLTDGSATTLEEAIEQWESTDVLFKDFQGVLKDTQDNNAKLRLLAYKALIAIASVADNSLFLSQDARNQIAEFQTSYESLKEILEPPF